jgi:hypothetical protein
VRNLREVLYHKEMAEPATLVGWLETIHDQLFSANQNQALAEFSDRILRKLAEGATHKEGPQPQRLELAATVRTNDVRVVG